jgi:protein-S-isoprenylcysteine O-methyltransferase Ste14
MSSFLIILAALAVYGVVHSLAASLRAKRLARQVAGQQADRWYRLGFSLFGGLTFLPVLILVAVLPDQVLYRVPFPWAIGFLALQAAGLLLYLWVFSVTDLWAFLGFRQVSTPDKQVEFLSKAGPYRYVRHPMYSASLLVLWCTPLMTLNFLALCLGVTAYFLIGGYFEERKLLVQFGEAYAEYRQRTPMLFPWPRRAAD